MLKNNIVRWSNTHTHINGQLDVRQMDTGAWLQGLLSLAWLTGQLSGCLTGLVGGISIGVEESKKSKKSLSIKTRRLRVFCHSLWTPIIV